LERLRTILPQALREGIPTISRRSASFWRIFHCFELALPPAAEIRMQACFLPWRGLVAHYLSPFPAVSQPTSEPAISAPPADHSRWFIDEVHAHDGQLKSYLRSSFPSVRDVDDVVQESYLRIWKACVSQSIRSAKGCLFQIARHVALDLIRHERASPISGVTDLADLRVLDTRPDAAEATCTREEIALLADAIDALPARCREIFILRKIKRIPQKGIAVMLGISDQTVQVQVFRGMKRCEEFLAQRGL
jgi:RNA polymerase sigma-70 factor (ECF subfamily)